MNTPMTAREQFVKALDYMSMCERAMHVTSMNEPCFAERRDELTSARNAVLRLFDAACQSGAGEAVAWRYKGGSNWYDCATHPIGPLEESLAQKYSGFEFAYTHPPKAEAVIVGGIRYFDRDEGDYGVMEFVTEKGDKVHVAIDKKTISWMVMANDKAGTLLSASAEHPLYTAAPHASGAGKV